MLGPISNTQWPRRKVRAVMANRRLLIGILIAIAAVSFFVSALVPQRMITGFLFYVFALCGIGCLLIALRSRKGDQLRPSGFLCGIGSLIIALSFFRIPWLWNPWLNFGGSALFLMGGLKAYNAFRKDRQKLDT